MNILNIIYFISLSIAILCNIFGMFVAGMGIVESNTEDRKISEALLDIILKIFVVSLIITIFLTLYKSN